MSRTVKTELICSECGNVFPIQRNIGRQRALYHYKKLYCIICKKQTNHIETKDLDSLLASLSFKEDLTPQEDTILQLVKRRNHNDN